MPTALEVIFWLAMVVAAITLCTLVLEELITICIYLKRVLKDYQNKR